MIGHESVKAAGSGVYHRLSQQGLCNHYQTHRQAKLNVPFFIFSLCTWNCRWFAEDLSGWIKPNLFLLTAPECEWHLLVNWSCSLSTCWCDPSALWSLRSVLQPRYVAFWQSFIPQCGLPGSSSEGHKGPVFCICKEMMKYAAPTHSQTLLFVPLSALQISSTFLSESVCVCVCVCVSVCVYYRWKRTGGSEDTGSRKSQIPGQASSACCLHSPIYSCSHSHKVEVWSHLAAACLQSCMHSVPLWILFIRWRTLSLYIRVVPSRIKTV